MIRICILFILVALVISCSNHIESLLPEQVSGGQKSIQRMMDSIAQNVSREGPVVWLHYFENTPGFFMASDGQIAFPDNDSAKNFINHTLIKSITKIELHWSNTRIDVLTNSLASVAANFHEDITDASGKRFPQDGYFTAIAHQTPGGWKLHNAHWSQENKMSR